MPLNKHLVQGKLIADIKDSVHDSAGCALYGDAGNLGIVHVRTVFITVGILLRQISSAAW